MAPRQVRVGIIGLGGLGNAHGEAYRDEPRVRLVAGCDVADDKRRDRASGQAIDPGR